MRRPHTLAPLAALLATALFAPAAAAGSWQVDVADAGSFAGRSNQLALDASSLPHVAYWHVTSGVRHAWFNGAYWQNELVEVPVGPEPAAGPAAAGPASTNLLINVSVAAAAFGTTPMLAYARENYLGHSPAYGPVRFGVRGPGGWTVENVGSLVGLAPALAVGPAGQVHLACLANNDVVYARRTEAGWESETVAPGVGYSRLSLCVDANDVPRLAYGEGSALRCATRTPQGWVSEPVANPAYGASLAVDGSGGLRMCYTTGGTLVYAMRGPGGWSGEPVAPLGSTWAETSLALDEHGRPRILFDCGPTGGPEIRFAFRDGGAWAVEVPDTSNATIQSPSLAIGAAGRAWASYNRLPGDQLLVATALPVAGVAPTAARFSLRLAGANPARAGAPLALALESPLAQDVTLELFDVAGRRVADRRLVRAAAGPQGIAWPAGDLRPGLYLLRARAAVGGAASLRVVVAD